MSLAVSVRGLAMNYGRRLVFRDVSFDLSAGQAAGVIGPNGAGKTTLLRAIAGCLAPHAGEIRINGLLPRDAMSRSGVGYFAGEATLPGGVRAARWGSLGAEADVTRESRRLRTLSRGTRQLLGLRTVLARHPLGLIVLDEPWEGLDPDAGRWLSTMLETKRDRGAAVVLSSHRLHDLAGLCDVYVFLVPHRATVLRAHEIVAVGAVTAEHLTGVFDDLRGRATPLRATLLTSRSRSPQPDQS
jgi:ABC-2 type transport system ATP-binding protein